MIFVTTCYIYAYISLHGQLTCVRVREKESDIEDLLLTNDNIAEPASFTLLITLPPSYYYFGAVSGRCLTTV